VSLARSPSDPRHDWDIYYERGRKPKESKTKDGASQAARSEDDYRRKVLLARIMRNRGGRTWYAERLRT